MPSTAAVDVVKPGRAPCSTGMCGCCRVEVGGVTKFACVDGPDFDATLVDWDDLRARQAAYRSEEGESLKAYEEKSCACH